MPIVSNTPAPPQKKTPPPKKTPVAPLSDEKIRSDREDGLNGVWTAATAFSMMGGNWADAGAFSIHGPNISREAAALSMRYEKIGSGLDALANISPFANLLGAVMPLILQLGANHGRIAADKVAGFGIKDPGVLESQMRVEAQRQAVEFQRMAAEEQMKLQKESEELNAMMTKD